MNRIVFIVPYFGRFNNYFPLWLKSCEHNADVADYIIISDIPYEGERPSNVKFIPYSWKDLIKKVQSFYDFEIKLETPYQLCDYKCAYGEIFHEYIVGYSHWAYGDVDLIWGKWSNFLPSNWYDYDKLGEFGHLTIIKNTSEMNRLYRYKDIYKIAFSDSRNLFFDEQGFNSIVKLHNKLTCSFKIADCNPRIKKIVPVTPLTDQKSGLFLWEHGILSHISENNGCLNKEEITYIHFLKRDMKYNSSFIHHRQNGTNGGGKILIIHDLHIEEIDSSDDEHLSMLVRRYSKNSIYFEYILKYFSFQQLLKTIKSRLYPTSIKVKEIQKLIN